jgi:two-component system nitrogen regulation response regulator NtrX
LQVLPIRVPSLSERRGDVELLARYFCEASQKTHGLRRLELSPGALRALRATTFRGNVRELSHLVEAGTIRAAGQDVAQVEVAHLFPPRDGREDTAVEEARTFQEETRAFQSQLLRQTLESNGWNIAATARQLDLTRSHVYNLIRSFGLARDRS